MRAAIEQGVSKKFRRASWRIQQTYCTPLKDLPRFVATIVGTLEACEGAAVMIDSVAMSKNHLEALLTRHQLAGEIARDFSLAAETASEVRELLAAALGDWVDFAFVPQPKPFVIFADHDEYTTFFANSRSNLNLVTAALDQGGFSQVSGYERNLA